MANSAAKSRAFFLCDKNNNICSLLLTFYLINEVTVVINRWLMEFHKELYTRADD